MRFQRFRQMTKRTVLFSFKRVVRLAESWVGRESGPKSLRIRQAKRVFRVYAISAKSRPDLEYSLGNSGPFERFSRRRGFRLPESARNATFSALKTSRFEKK